MNDYLIAAAGLLAGFIIAKLIRIIRLNQYHKEVSETLLRCMEMENEYARELAGKSMVEYTVEKKGTRFGILYFGGIYHLLSGIPRRDADVSEVEEAMALFLHEALKDDIENYRRERNRRKHACTNEGNLE